MTHVVILGAGATIAAIPNGDKNGIKSPSMNNFFELTGMQDVLNEFEIKTESKNLEDIYSELYENPKYKDKIHLLDDAIYNYFSKLELPKKATIYDHLILCLNDNDLIATFNWDPLLIQAYVRCSKITDKLPGIAFLHGNVSLGYCSKCKAVGQIDYFCKYCGDDYEKSKLLFPINNKNYNKDEMINEYWLELQKYIKDANHITIFGYGAPTSDIEAIKIFKEAWGDINDRQLEEFSFINIEEENVCLEKWKDFVHGSHYRYSKSFYDSYIALFPRRSCQVEFTTHNFNLNHTTEFRINPEDDFEQIEKKIIPLIEEEEKTSRLTSKYYYKPHK